MSYETLLYDTDGAIATITLNRPDRLNTIVPPMPDELEAAIDARGGRWRREGDRAARSRSRLLRGIRSRRRLPPLGRGPDDRREVGPGQGLRDGDLADVRARPQVHEHLALAKAGDRAGPRLVRRGWQRHGALRRSRDRLRGCSDRHALLADVGVLPHRHVDLPARPDTREGVRADRQAAVGPRGGRGRPDQRGGAVRRGWSRRSAPPPSASRACRSRSWPR